MKKSIRLIAAALAAVSAMSCASVPGFASGSDYFTYVDTIAGIQFNSVDDLTAFIAENEGKSSIKNVDKKVSEWILSADALYIPAAAEDNISDIIHILITPTYVSTMFESGGRKYELYCYTDSKAGETQLEVAKNNSGEAIYDTRKTDHDGKTVYFSHILTDSNYTWKENGNCFNLRVYDSDGFGEGDLNFCAAVSYPLKESASGWRTVNGKKYYYDENGKKTTKPATIDGVLYKFGKDGVCLGRYTGWAVAGNGRYYYKDGVKIKNRWLRVGGKKVYYLLKSGKAATGTVTIGGREYTFDKKGRLVS